MKFRCPICAFLEMPYPARPYNICPCCGTEFGVDDHVQTETQIREAWIAQGMPWFDDITSPPRNWSPSLQLISGGYGSELIRPTSEAAEGQRRTVALEITSFVSADYKPYPIYFAVGA